MPLRESAVAADMQAIFGEMQARKAPRPIAPLRRSPQGPTASPPAGRALRLLAPFVVLLALAISIVAFALRPQAEADLTPPPAAVTATPPREPAASSRTAPPVLERQAVTVLAESTSTPRVSAPAIASRPASAASSEPARDPALKPPASRREIAAPKSQAAAPPKSSTSAKTSGEAPGIDIASAPRKPRAGSRCARDPDGCLYDKVRAADERLVRAYQRARFAGVPVAELRAVRGRWDRAQRRSLDEPGATIGVYNRLADELDRARSRLNGAAE